MLKIGIIKEGKSCQDNRVAFSPQQCSWIQTNFPTIKIYVQPSTIRCYKDEEYARKGISLLEDLSSCDILFGIKEVPIEQLIPNKTYLFFSHTKKQQSYNQKLFHNLMDKNITLIDYECLEYEDGQRIIGFGFFAGIVGAHNGILSYGKRTNLYNLNRVYLLKDFKALMNSYFGLKLPTFKIAVTGSGRVATGIIEIMNLLEIKEVEQDEYIEKKFSYPVFVQLKGSNLYQHKINKNYNRVDFHTNPQNYVCTFTDYLPYTDILMNGIYWEKNIPPLFELKDIQQPNVRLTTIADITDDANGSVPCNLGDSTIENPFYGVNKFSNTKTQPFIQDSIDIMAVGNLPNELPRDASHYFGEQLIKNVLPGIIELNEILNNATILKNGKLMPRFQYLEGYASH